MGGIFNHVFPIPGNEINTAKPEQGINNKKVGA